MSSEAISLATAVPVAPFDVIADAYDYVFTDSLIGRAQRDAVWRECDRTFHRGQRILELNCGTGVDAVHLAGRGVRVLACDVAPRMIEVARRRVHSLGLDGKVEFRVLATEQIASLRGQGPFDGVFSNFGGLNCVEDLSAVARDLGRLLSPGSTALLCMLGRWAAWEIAWYMGHGKPRKALRRFQTDGASGRLGEGVTVKVHYPPVSALARIFAPEFRLRRRWGIGLTVPPSYLEPQAKRFPGALRTLARIDRSLAGLPVFRNVADHVLLEFQRVAAPA